MEASANWYRDLDDVINLMNETKPNEFELWGEDLSSKIAHQVAGLTPIFLYCTNAHICFSPRLETNTPRKKKGPKEIALCKILVGEEQGAGFNLIA